MRRQRIWTTRSSSPSRPTKRIELAVHGGLGQVAGELGKQAGLALTLLRRSLLLGDAGELVANLGELEAALLENLRGEAFFFAQEAEEQVFGADVLVAQTLGFFRGVGQDTLAFVGKRKVDGGGDLLANGGVGLNLLANGINRGVRAQETIGERLVFAQQAEQKVLGFNIGRAELAGLIAREEDDPPCLLRIAFEHGVLPGSG